MFKKISDKSIIEGIRNQDDTTLNWLYNNYYNTVSKHILKNNGVSDDVSDVFQDTIIVLYNQITDGTLNLTSDLKGYFFGIARNIWNTQLRKKRKTVELELDLLQEPEIEEDNDRMYERIVNRAFQKLKPDSQAVLNLYYEGCSYDEIAVKMNLKNEGYARRKKYLSKEALMEMVYKDPEYQEFLRYQK
ncbi:MAG TPA: sigma-70 family RNA polymerase sigma factor [Bacteroidales bacterium]|nr:sigma-70 family RNA polymerase sigma factor [Bacteroidales bacterium]OQB65700.1 MAG: RNA polymerase sigma factor RpoE [Bacteroidetes bacterium ADurb.Bin145]HOU02153.1 sigma-70 family RNA polymerase sigma factor [Bacteroidales bacterium]HQK67525.1 sigma-70 family RNA polymerase sigma factor [Bacteroidales bacterium]